MQRLFIGLGLPDSIADQLVAVQPGASRHVRPVSRQQFHITLHFIGQADTATVVEILQDVETPAFVLQLRNLGRFKVGGNASILWAGVNGNDHLFELHKKLGERLRQYGYPVSTAPYIPHVTLARCKNVSQMVLDDFTSRSLPATEPFAVEEFALYSSELQAGRSVYRREQSFALMTN